MATKAFLGKNVSTIIISIFGSGFFYLQFLKKNFEKNLILNFNYNKKNNIGKKIIKTYIKDKSFKFKSFFFEY